METPMHHAKHQACGRGAFRTHAGSAVMLALIYALGLTAGCSLTQPQADPTRFYVLSSSGTAQPVTPVDSAPVLHLRQVELPSYVRSRPLLVRKGNNEIEYR